MYKYPYIAGLLDGEGSVMLLKDKAKFRIPCVSVTSTSYELLEILVDTFGGSIKKQKVYKEHHKQSWSWTVKYDRAINMLEKIRPYMLEKEKIRRADLILNKYKDVTVRNGRYTPEQLQEKQNFEKEFIGG